MNAEQDTIDRAIELAATGSPKDGIASLWPLMRDESTREEAIYALAYCFEKDENFVTATYLYDWITKQRPDFTVALKRLSECREVLKERDLVEDFADAGHVPCPCGLLRQRAEYGVCPYCGQGAEGPETEGGWEAVESSSTKESETAAEEPGPVERIREEGRIALEKTRTLVESEELQPAVERFNLLKEETAERLKEFSQREPVKRFTEKAGKIGHETSERIKAFVESEPVQDIAKKAREIGHEASEKVKEISDRPKVQEAKAQAEKWGHERSVSFQRWITSGRVRETAKKVATGFERFLAKIQAMIDRIKGS